MSVIAVSDLSLKYKGNRDYTLRNVSFNLSAGELLLVSGENGSGKSTLLRAIIKLFPKGSIEKSTGKIVISEKPTIVFQRAKSQIITFRVDEEIATSLSFQNLSRKERKKRVLNVINNLQFAPDIRNDPRILSSGEQQLLVILSAIIDERKLVLLDEPLALLDGENKELLINSLYKLKKEGHSVIIVDHTESIPEDLITHEIALSKVPNVDHSHISQYAHKLKDANILNLVTIRGDIGIGYRSELFDIDPNCINGITLVIGPNGSGKTALLKTLANVIPPIRNKLKANTYSYVPQDSMSFFYKPSVRHEIMGMPEEEWMIPFLDKSPFILSEGDRKKLSLSIGFNHNSHLLLDEPTQSLDKNNIFWLLGKILETEQRDITIATNNSDFIKILSPYADNILELLN